VLRASVVGKGTIRYSWTRGCVGLIGGAVKMTVSTSGSCSIAGSTVEGRGMAGKNVALRYWIVWDGRG
jgi:hypothetical protein